MSDRHPFDPQYADDGVSELQEKIAELCEAAGIPDEVWNAAVLPIWKYQNGHWRGAETSIGWDIRDGPLPRFVKEQIARRERERLEALRGDRT